MGTVQIDEAEVRVTEWRLPPGHHRHEYDYVVVPMTDGELTVVVASGTSRAPIAAISRRILLTILLSVRRPRNK